MRQIIASAVIAATAFTAASPTFAQSSPRPRRAVQQRAPEQIQGNSIAEFESIKAVTSGTGVVIQWTMARENRVAIYQVYRSDSRGRVAVGSPVIGSAGKTRQDFMYGESYSAFDPDGTPASVYDIEAIGVNKGAKAGSEQFSPSFDRGASLMAAAAQETANAGVTNSSFQTNGPVAPEAQLLAPNLTTQQWVAAQPGVKIGVKSEGLYRVTRAELDAAGFSTISGSGNSTNWRLFESGNEVPIIVGAGDQYVEFYGRGVDTAESDTRMYYLIVDTVPGARIQTHTLHSGAGTPTGGSFRSLAQMKERTLYLDTLFNGDTENYWGAVITSGSAANEKITLANVDPNGPDAILTVTIQGYSNTPHDVQVFINGSSTALPTHVTGQSQQSYSANINVPAAMLVNGTNTVTLKATTVNPNDLSIFDNMKVSFSQLYQASGNAMKIFTAGRRKVVLNGFSSPGVSTVTISSATQNLGSPTTGTTTVASSSAGVFRLSSPAYSGMTGGSSAARVTVSRVYGSTGSASVTVSLTGGTAVGGSACGSGADYVNPGPQAVSFANGEISKDIDVTLCSGAVAGRTFNVSLSNPAGASLASSNIRVFDLTSDAPQVLGGLQPTQAGNDNGVVLPIYRAATLYALDDAYALQAKSVTANTPSTLSAMSNAADMLIISYSDPSFIAASNTWANYRQQASGGGFNVKVVDVADIYDEFGYGVRSANSINSFLKFAYQSWQTKPKYILLVGDASLDPRNYAGFGDWDLVPTKMVTLVFQESGSDDALADFNGDGLAEIPIGRIPARTAATVTQLYNKMVAQESASGQSFGRGAVFVNGAPRGYDFASMNQTLRNELTNVSTATVVNETDPSPTANTVNALNTGPYIVNYAGHGAAGQWGDSGFFQSSTVSQLTNTNNQSIYTMLTCFNGYFINNSPTDCLAETILKSSAGGASLVWASTTETTPDIQLIMGQRFYHQLNAAAYKRVGDLILDAKAQIPGGSDVRYSWALLGDPATQIRP